MQMLKMVLIVVCLSGLVACNTVKGFGEDLQAGGKAITKKAESSK